MYERFCRETLDENGVLTEFRLTYPENFNFAYDVVDEIADQEPEKTALVWCDAEGYEKIISFREMAGESARAARFLADSGVKQGDRVMLILKRHYEYWYTVLALHRIGAVAVPVTYMLKKDDIRYRLDSARIKAVVCAEDLDICENVRLAAEAAHGPVRLFNVRADRAGFTRLDLGMEAEEASYPRPDSRATDPFILYFTSGTTGDPKGVVHDGSYPLAHIVTARHWQRAEDGGLHLSVADTGWGKASWGKIYGQWLCGAAVMVYDFDRFDPEALTRVICRYGVTSFCAPPTIYRFLVKTGLRREDFASVRYAATAGEALNPEIIEKFHALTGLPIRVGYGQTETTLLIGDLGGERRKVGSMGKASPLFRLSLVDSRGRAVPDGQVGEIAVIPQSVHDSGLLLGYDSNREADRAAWRCGVFHTGDLAYRDRDGYYWYVGRADDIIKSSGYKISPFEVESVLLRHPAVLECAVTGVPDQERGFVVKATVVLQQGAEAGPALVRELQAFVKRHTAPYKYPRIIEFAPELPKTASGKVKHHTIRRRDSLRPAYA